MSFSQEDRYWFAEGTHRRLYRVLGAHAEPSGGTRFAVWAPSASAVSVIGDFNDWNPHADALEPVAASGVWQGVVAAAARGSCYKFHVRDARGGSVDKADPFAFRAENPPKTASVITALDYQWRDGEWMENRSAAQDRPMSIYEVHLGSWRRRADGQLCSYAELADDLVPYVSSMGFTHVELMPVTEHPFYGSWGYQVTGYFAATARYGTPQELMALVDRFHGEGIGVILDWVPAHFPTDEHGLGLFDGTHLFEHADPRQGFHPDWNTYIYNYGRNEVRSFLLSSAMFWLDRYHVDGLRVDGVASMLYLDYSRAEGEWIPNRYGGRENLDAVSFLRQVNDAVHEEYPSVLTIAEESTAWPQVSNRHADHGLRFDYKWDMGWMHDTLEYFKEDPVHRKYHQDKLTFRGVYAFDERFVLSLSHDECVHGKGSLLSRMPGDEWQRFANLRLLYAYMYALPGKKLLFMGDEFGQAGEWSHEAELDWPALDEPLHRGVAALVTELNRLHRDHPALYQRDETAEGFSWIDYSDSEQSVLAFERIASDGDERIVCVFNFTPVPRRGYRVGVTRSDSDCWTELLSTDAEIFGGSGVVHRQVIRAEAEPMHGRGHSVVVDLPPLGATWLVSGEA